MEDKDEYEVSYDDGTVCTELAVNLIFSGVGIILKYYFNCLIGEEPKNKKKLVKKKSNDVKKKSSDVKKKLGHVKKKLSDGKKTSAIKKRKIKDIENREKKKRKKS